ncbi:unnamed protein product [Linum trigynum]|uniref:Uncharacterized protein n=1 Tax=Linum trigynum TaxID=586398 RepID=A0AAV2CP15_9ROSI
MNAVDSALDPLVFDYISCSVSDIVNNLWTWVAVLTAAVSFWRIRTAAAGEAAPSTPPRNSSSILRLTLHVPAPPFVLHLKTSSAAVSDEVQTEALVSTPKTPASSPIICDDDDVVTKGKFVAYYRQEVEVEVEEEEEQVGGGDNGGDGNAWWETELRVRMGRGELGWYKYQDLTAINGNVVRLWDGGRSGDGESYDGSSKCNPRCCLVW